jgi:hypothetical protein
MRILTMLLIGSIAVVCGCRQDAAPASARQSPMRPSSNAKLPAAEGRENVELTIRKLSADGKEVRNQIHIKTPVGDDFTVTEQIGTTQFEVRGNVTALPGGKYRVSYSYSELSAGGRKGLQSTLDVTPGAQEKLGGVIAEGGTEAVVLTLAQTPPPGR